MIHCFGDDGFSEEETITSTPTNVRCILTPALCTFLFSTEGVQQLLLLVQALQKSGLF